MRTTTEVTRGSPVVGDGTKTTGQCAIPNCEKDAGKGIQYCWAHYQRRRRGAKDLLAPVRAHKMDDRQLSPIRVPEPIALALEGEAAKRNISVYQLTRLIVTEWVSQLSR